MSSPEIARDDFPPLPIKIISSITLVAFTSYMLHSWQRDLSQAKIASTTVAQAAPTQPSNPPVVAAPEMTQKTEVIAEIKDPKTLAELNQKLYDQLNQAWQTAPTFSDNLVYQVKVNQQGAIASYQGINKAAVDFVKETPMSNLVLSDTAAQPVGQFLVVLTPSGLLQVNPWVPAKN